MNSYGKRPSPIAGSWFSSDPKVLKNTIQQYLNHVEPTEIKDEIIGLIAPHAGYYYSGQTAAAAYVQIIEKKYDHVVVCSPLHAYHPAPVLTSSHRSYEIPFGEVFIDHEKIQEIDDLFYEQASNHIVSIGYDQEHSLEIQLPFLCSVIHSDFKLIPLMVRTHDFSIIKKLANSVTNVLAGESVLFIASTDLSHFYPQKIAKSFDQVMIDSMLKMDGEEVLNNEKNKKGYACGAGAVASVLEMTKNIGLKKAHLLDYSTSGDVSGDLENVVGYVSIGLVK